MTQEALREFRERHHIRRISPLGVVHTEGLDDRLGGLDQRRGHRGCPTVWAREPA